MFVPVFVELYTLKHVRVNLEIETQPRQLKTNDANVWGISVQYSNLSNCTKFTLMRETYKHYFAKYNLETIKKTNRRIDLSQLP